MKVETQKVNDHLAYVNVNVPFSCCKMCDMLEIDETIIYGNGDIYMRTRNCANSDICNNFAKLIKYEE